MLNGHFVLSFVYLYEDWMADGILVRENVEKINEMSSEVIALKLITLHL